MKPILNKTLQLTSLLCLICCTNTMAMAAPPVVAVYAQHYGGLVVYNYRLINNTLTEISSVQVGYDVLNKNTPNNYGYELKSYPSGMVDPNIPQASVTSPAQWEAIHVSPEETPEGSIWWHVLNNNSPRLAAGQTLSGMSIKLDKIDNSYLNSHATIHFSNSVAADVSVLMQHLDTTPPSLSLTLNPSVLHPNDKLVAIAAQITVKDDYDPLPDIKLISITANEPLEAEDIRGAAIGKDTRSFSLRADHNERSKTARIYTVTYSATDASGNTSTASATVIVAREQEDKNHAEQHPAHEQKPLQKHPATGGAGALPF